jgi:hypothetical protein
MVNFVTGDNAGKRANAELSAVDNSFSPPGFFIQAIEQRKIGESQILKLGGEIF